MLVVLGGILTPNAEAAYRDIIQEKLVFYYVDNPGATLPSPTLMEVDKRTIARGGNLTTPLWTNADNAGLKDLLKALLKDPARGGDANLQRTVANVIGISGKKVHVYLYHDTGNLTKDTSMLVYCTNSGAYGAANSNASWPCASMYEPHPVFTGLIGIGAHFFSSGSRGGYSTTSEKRMVFVHELVHTQTAYQIENGLADDKKYGTDESHSVREMIPSKNSAFNEGIANAFGFRYHRVNSFNITGVFNSNGNLWVEDDAACSSASTFCLQDRLSGASVAEQTPCLANHKCYAIRDVPVDIILHNELITSNLLYQVMNQFDNTMLLVEAVQRASTEMGTVGNYTFMPVFKELTKGCKAYINPSNPTGAKTKGMYMPLAALDFYTGYKVNSKATLARILGTTWGATDTNIDAYFSSHRATLMGYRTNATTWDEAAQLGRLATHLNIRTATTPTATIATED